LSPLPPSFSRRGRRSRHSRPEQPDGRVVQATCSAHIHRGLTRFPRARDTQLRPGDYLRSSLRSSVNRPSARRTGPGWIHEIKFDGFRFACRVEDGAVTLRTRNGMDWMYRAREAAAALSRLPDVYLDGELCVLGPDGQPDFGALQKALRTDG
jgi:ATP-dependent DNA ligase